MIESTVQLNILGKRWDDCLSSRHKPFEDGRFKGLGVMNWDRF
jgi:hypothetical protein